MAALFTDAELNALADYEASRVGYLSLHTASPGTTGANEATGGSPAYARKAITWNAAGAVGPLGSTAQPATVGVAWGTEVTFDVPAGSYTHGGLQSAATAGTFRGGNTLGATQTLTGQGQVKVSGKIGPFVGS